MDAVKLELKGVLLTLHNLAETHPDRRFRAVQNCWDC